MKSQYLEVYFNRKRSSSILLIRSWVMRSMGMVASMIYEKGKDHDIKRRQDLLSMRRVLQWIDKHHRLFAEMLRTRNAPHHNQL